jgi:hypothetical protein
MEKKQIFISQPMAGKEADFIAEERAKAIAYAKENFGDDCVIVDSYFPDFNGNSVQFLGKSIEVLGSADVALFLSGWAEARGCAIEHSVCEKYGIEVCEI